MENPKSGAPGGPWPIFKEKSDSSVVKQFNGLACIAACAEMLLQSRGIEGITQRQIFEASADPNSNLSIGRTINKMSDIVWRAGCLADGDSIEELEPIIRELSIKPWSAMMYYFGGKIGHNILVDGLDKKGNVMIRDPWQGTKYKMKMPDFVNFWGLIGIKEE